MWQEFRDIVWLYLPAACANMVPIVAARYGWLPVLARPLDGGRHWRGQRLLGEHKTWRGLMCGVAFGGLVALLQYLALGSLESPLVPYAGWLEALGWGAWIGLAALVGDALKSLIKRQRRIPSGQPWRPWDQIDAPLGVILLTWWFVPLTLVHVLLLVSVFGVLSLITSWIGVRARVKNSV